MVKRYMNGIIRGYAFSLPVVRTLHWCTAPTSTRSVVVVYKLVLSTSSGTSSSCDNSCCDTTTAACALACRSDVATAASTAALDRATVSDNTSNAVAPSAGTTCNQRRHVKGQHNVHQLNKFQTKDSNTHTIPVRSKKQHRSQYTNSTCADSTHDQRGSAHCRASWTAWQCDVSHRLCSCSASRAAVPLGTSSSYSHRDTRASRLAHASRTAAARRSTTASNAWAQHTTAK